MLSDNRVSLGVGAGWMREEFDLLGQDFDNRGPRLDEMIQALRELWKGGYIFAARMLSMFLGMAFIVSRHPAYSWYADKGRTHGLSPLSDQQLAGGLMLSVDIIVMVAALAYFFWQAALTEDREQAKRASAEALTGAG